MAAQIFILLTSYKLPQTSTNFDWLRLAAMGSRGPAAGRNSPVRRTGAEAQFVTWRHHFPMSKSSGGHKFPRRRPGAKPEAMVNMETHLLTVVKLERSRAEAGLRPGKLAAGGAGDDGKWIYYGVTGID